jgi:hypothetical protein
MADKSISDTDISPDSPQGVGESVTKQGNQVTHGADDEALQRDDTDRDRMREQAQDPERERDRMQGSIDPQRPGPDPTE